MPRKITASFDEAVESFFRHRHGISPLTERYYRGALRRFAAQANARTIADLSAANVNRYLVSIHKSPHMARGDCAVLKVFGKWLVRAKIINADPLAAIETPDAPKSKPKPMSVEIQRAVIELAGTSRMASRDRCIALVSLDSGARPWEIGQLEWPEDVDLERGVIYIRGDRLKTKASVREIDLDPATVAALDEYVKDYRPAIVGRLFLSEDGGPLSYNGFLAIHKRLRDRLKREGVDGYTAYLNRHTGITNHARVPGITLADVKARAGHSSAITTMGYMGGRSLQELRRLPSALSYALGRVG